MEVTDHSYICLLLLSANGSGIFSALKHQIFSKVIVESKLEKVRYKWCSQGSKENQKYVTYGHRFFTNLASNTTTQTTTTHYHKNNKKQLENAQINTGKCRPKKRRLFPTTFSK